MISKNCWKLWLIFITTLSALFLFPTKWITEHVLSSTFHRGPQPSFYFMDCGNFCSPRVRLTLNNGAALDNNTLWQLKHVNTLAHFPEQYHSSIETLRWIRANYVKSLKTLPENFGISRYVNESLHRPQEARYSSCPCTNLVSINENGRLGNKMSQYMTLLGQSKRLHFRPVISSGMSHILRSIFPRLSIPSQDNFPCKCKWTNVHMSELIKMKSKEELFAHGESIFIPEFPTQIEIFEQFYPSVMREFVFNRGIKQEVQTYLDQVKRDFRLRMGINQHVNVTIVGVHNRRTDYASYLRSKVQGRLLSTLFFENAMNAFTSAHGKATLFIMISDDPQWFYQHFKERQDVFFSFQNWPKCRDKVAFDMAVAASADHSIFSFGTFGFWGAYLAGGEAIMATNFSSKPQELLIAAKTNIKRWTFMTDPCLNNGRVADKCARNKTRFGLQYSLFNPSIYTTRWP